MSGSASSIRAVGKKPLDHYDRISTQQKTSCFTPWKLVMTVYTIGLVILGQRIILKTECNEWVAEIRTIQDDIRKYNHTFTLFRSDYLKQVGSNCEWAYADCAPIFPSMAKQKFCLDPMIKNIPEEWTNNETDCEQDVDPHPPINLFCSAKRTLENHEALNQSIEDFFRKESQKPFFCPGPTSKV